MFATIKKYWDTSDEYYLIPILITIFSAVFIALFFIINYQNLPEKLPLFYSLPWGEAQLSTKQQFSLLPIMLILIGLINTTISSQLHKTQYILKRILMLSLILVDAIVLITSIKIMSIFI